MSDQRCLTVVDRGKLKMADTCALTIVVGLTKTLVVYTTITSVALNTSFRATCALKSLRTGHK